MGTPTHPSEDSEIKFPELDLNSCLRGVALAVRVGGSLRYFPWASGPKVNMTLTPCTPMFVTHQGASYVIFYPSPLKWELGVFMAVTNC